MQDARFGAVQTQSRTVRVVEGISQGNTQLLEMRSATTHSWNCDTTAKNQSIKTAVCS